ncbi:MAG TPA: VWA domain-containing protein [Pyrinomonadaceae bacterium]
MRLAFVAIVLVVVSTTCFAQDTIKVSVEEVRIPIIAKDSGGRFDPTVELNDLLVRDNGIAQPLKSVYRMPASVLLLLDTGEELNRAKNVRLTREATAALIADLKPDDRIAVMQVNNRVELLQPWTTKQADAIKSLNQLLPGKRTALEAGLLAAIEQFRQIEYGNSHLVLISDGVDTKDEQSDLTDAYRSLLAANVTLHVISYASLGTKVEAPEPARPRVKSAVAPELIEALPRSQRQADPTPDLKSHMKNKGGVLLDIDLLFGRKGIKPALVERTEEFSVLTEETGGNLWLPGTAEEMVRRAHEVARDIDAQYVMSYRPRPPLASSGATEYRRIEVISRRVGLTIKSRRGYVVRPDLLLN